MPSALSTFGNSLSLRVDGAIGAMSLNPNGRDAVLAGRRGLFIIDLDDPFTAPRWLHHITLWEVADVQWLPHHTVKPLWVILTLNQRALLWDLNRPLANAIAHVLHGHTRAITDINFHPGDPELLATCSVDTFALAWDMRAPRTPAMKWAEWRAGATQVKWNHHNQYQIATCHDHSFYLWDTRKGALPMVKIRGAHAGKINGLDFSRGLSQIITLSNDNKVKVWDLTTPQAQLYIDKFDYFSAANTNRGVTTRVTPQVVVDCEFPVAKARWLPFGSDSCFGIMPLRGGNNAIHIANLLLASSTTTEEGDAIPLSEVEVHQFEGHTGDIKDFLWRQRHQHYLDGTLYPSKDYQLVTWLSHDYDLKLWSNDDGLGDLYSKVNYNPGFVPVLDDSSDEEVVYDYRTYLYEPPVTIDDMRSVTCGDTLLSLALLEINAAKKDQARLGNVDHLDWILGVRLGGKRVDADGYPTNLGEEVSIVGRKFPKVRFEKISVSTGEIVVSFRGVRPEVTKEEKVPEPADYSLTNEDETGTVTSAGKLTGKTDDSAPQALTSLLGGGSDSVNLVFMRLQIDFPSLYPFLSATSKKRRNLVRFKLEETHELDAAAITTIEAQLDEIAQFYSNKHQKFCLEPCLRMLMGEKIELDDEALAAAMGETQDGTLEAIEEIASDRSSLLMVVSDDEDEDNPPSVVDDFDDGVIEFAEPPSQNVNFFDLTPVPKGCGATWTPTGQLVCFFVPTEDRPKKLDIFHFAELGADDGQTATAPVSENDTSDDLDFSRADDGSSSDDDSFQEEWDALIAGDAPLRARVPALFKTVVGLGNEYGGLLSHKHPGKLVGGGTANNQLLVRRLQKHKKNLNIVGIFDYSHLMQAKVDLGYEYRILGDTPERLARHNGEVATKYGLTDIAHTWRILEMTLIKNVDTFGAFELVGPYGQSTQNQWDSEGRIYSQKPPMFFWGHHPFGHSWLVKELFTYYEQQGNIQMLAMMACILHENARNLHLLDDAMKVPIHTPYRALPPPPTVLALVPGEVAKQTWQPALSLALDVMMRLALVMSLPKLKQKRPLVPTVGTPNSAPLYASGKHRLSKKVRLPPTVTVEMLNMDSMDIYDDAYLCGLLSSLDPDVLRRYRQQYADLLYLWGLPVNRIKVLKFNYANGPVTSNDGDQHKCHIALRSRRKQNPRQAFVNLVTFIELSKLNAWNLGKRTVLKYCNLCALVVKKNFVVCTLCEHILHTQCAMEWWGANEQECASGCGCNCMLRPFSLQM